MSKRKAPRKAIAEPPTAPLQPPRRLLALIMLATTAALITLVVWRTKTPTANFVEVAAMTQLISPANTCRRSPPFVNGLGFGSGVSLSTSERDLQGLALVEYSVQGRSKSWQHPSWRQAGNLAAFAVDASGNVYVLPAPRVDLLINPPHLQNRIYKVDANSGEMTLLLEFPVPSLVGARNPYAGLGLAYDCDLDSLFLSSIAGSDLSTERGEVMRIALSPRLAIKHIYRGLDVFGIASMNTKDGKMLSLGHARTGALLRLPYSAQGDFVGKAEPFASLQGLGPEGNERARRFDLLPDGSLRVSGAKFNYNLAQPSAQAAAIHYRFEWDAATSTYPFAGWQAKAGL